MELLEYIDIDGNSPFRVWFDKLDVHAAAKVAALHYARVLRKHLERKGRRRWRAGTENRLAKGYRMYFGKDGEQVIFLPGGGTKRRQSRDIAAATERWLDYKARKTGKA